MNLEVKQLMPLADLQTKRLIQGAPHETHGRVTSAESRLACAELLGWETLTLLAAPLRLIYRIGVIIVQLAQVIFYAFRLAYTSKQAENYAKRVKEVDMKGFEIVDQLALVPYDLIVNFIMILKMACSILFPKIYFKLPPFCSTPQQIKYYQKISIELLDNMLDSREIDREKKTMLHLLLDNLNKILIEIQNEEKRLAFLIDTTRQLREIKICVSNETLTIFKTTLEANGRDFAVELDFSKWPLIPAT